MNIKGSIFFQSLHVSASTSRLFLWMNTVQFCFLIKRFRLLGSLDSLKISITLSPSLDCSSNHWLLMLDLMLDDVDYRKLVTDVSPCPGSPAASCLRGWRGRCWACTGVIIGERRQPRHTTQYLHAGTKYSQQLYSWRGLGSWEYPCLLICSLMSLSLHYIIYIISDFIVLWIHY